MPKHETGDVAFTLLRQKALWLATGINGGFGFAGFRKDSTCVAKATPAEQVAPRFAAGGFTLTEVVVAVVLMLLALALLLSAFISSKRSVALVQTHLTALQIARSEAERLQTNSYGSISNGPTCTTLTNALIEYRMSNSVTTNVLDSYKYITVAVEWLAPASSRRQTLTNYITICNTNRN